MAREDHVSPEYYQLPEEYHKQAPESFTGHTGKKTSDEEEAHSRKIRRMGYLVAAAVATITVSQAAIQNVPGGTYVDISQAIAWGTANGGVIPIETGANNWSLMDLSGEIVSTEGYYQLKCRPNKNGYCAFYKFPDLYCVLNSRGEEVFSFEGDPDIAARETRISVTDDDIILVQQSYQYIGFWTVDGQKIFEAEAEPDKQINATVFAEGAAIIDLNYLSGADELYLLTEDGQLTGIAADEDRNWWNEESPLSGGRAIIWDTYYDCRLMDLQGETPAITLDLMASAERITGMKACGNYDALGAYYLNSSTVFEDQQIWPAPRPRYTENDSLLVYNYGTYACMQTTTNEGAEKCVLFDFREVDRDTGILNNAIAVFDDIRMNDFSYLRAREGKDYFYIDFEGNIVSDSYAYATSFNDAHYAAVIEKNGDACLIDEKFQIVDRITDVSKIEPCGEAFVLEKDGEVTLYVPPANE